MKTVLITGTNRGIGLELVNQYLSDGWKVIACSRHAKKSSDKDRLIHIDLDVTDSSQIKNLANKLKNESIDVLINNAGVSGPDKAEMDLLDPKAWLDTFLINSAAPYAVSQALSKQVASSSTKVIANISSIYGSVALNTDAENFPIYRASKAALNSVTKCLANGFQKQGITVISVHPGSVRTDMNPTGKISVQESAQGIKKVLSSLSLKNSGTFVDYNNAPLSW